jgi:hypothetical protein
MKKYIVWVKERGGEWEPNGDGPVTAKTADRIVRELRGMCRACYLPEGIDKVKSEDSSIPLCDRV